MPKIQATQSCSEPESASLVDLALERQRRRAWDAWEAAGIPKRHGTPFESTHAGWNSKRYELTKKLGHGFLVALLGDRGTGKTQMAADLIREDARTPPHPHPLYVRAIDIFMGIREAYRPKGPTEREQVEEYTTKTLLVIDDAHERGGSDWENRLLGYIIDRRYGDKLDTLLISNQQPDEFKASIGPSIYSRLIETGGIVLCAWPSFRQAQPAEFPEEEVKQEKPDANG